MPYNPDKDPKPFTTDEQAREAALGFIQKLGKIIGHLIPHTATTIKNDQEEVIGAKYRGTKGRTVTIRRDTHPTEEERRMGITRTWDVKLEGGETKHFASTQVRRVPSTKKSGGQKGRK